MCFYLICCISPHIFLCSTIFLCFCFSVSFVAIVSDCPYYSSSHAPLKSERAAITGGRWATRPKYPQRAPKAQILALPLNECTYSSLEKEWIPKYRCVKGRKGEPLSCVCVLSKGEHKLKPVAPELRAPGTGFIHSCVFSAVLF